jgi:hypothetical protein
MCTDLLLAFGFEVLMDGIRPAMQCHPSLTQEQGALM